MFCSLIVAIALAADPDSSTLYRSKNYESRGWLAWRFAETPVAADGVTWGVGVLKDATNYDTLWFESTVTNQSFHRMFTPADQRSGPTLVLTPQGGKPIMRRLSEGKPRSVSSNFEANPGEAVHAFRVDLRQYFGRLAPGTYTIQSVWPAKEHGLRDRNGPISVDLKSPAMTVVVTGTTLAEAEKWLEPGGKLLKFKFDRAPGDSSTDALQTATLRNGGPVPIEFDYRWSSDQGPDKVPVEPLRVEIDAYWFHPKPTYEYDNQQNPSDLAPRWRGQKRLSSQPLTARGTRGIWARGLSVYSLKPGASVKIALPDWVTDGDGIFCYTMRYEYHPLHPGSPEGTGPKQVRWTCSPAFIVDTFGKEGDVPGEPSKPRH